MSFRTVVIKKRSKLDLRMGYLVVRQDDDTIRVFLDEINTLIVENPACCISGCLLTELVNKKVKVIFCDEKHSPSSELIPCHGHGESSGKLHEQINWDQNFCQWLWTRIVAEKINNSDEICRDMPERRLSITGGKNFGVSGFDDSARFGFRICVCQSALVSGL